MESHVAKSIFSNSAQRYFARPNAMDMESSDHTETSNGWCDSLHIIRGQRSDQPFFYNIEHLMLNNS